MLRQRVVLFGGMDYKSVYFDGTFEWDGAAWSVVPVDLAPSLRTGHSMAWDPVNHEVLLFGGGNWQMGPTNETWTWNGARWKRWNPPISPLPRGGCAMACDPVRQVVVLFGGGGSSGLGTVYYDETWEWDGTTWNLRQPAHRPMIRGWGSAAYCARAAQIVLFGGNLATLIPNETWTYDGNDWQLAAGTAASPPGRTETYMSSTPQGTVMLHGGQGLSRLNDTWEWDGNQWQQLPGTGTLPLMYGAVLAEDPVNQTVLHLGDERWHKTSLWRGNGWQQVWNANPVGSAFLAVWDRHRDARVVYDGADRTYEQDGSGVLHLKAAAPAVMPPHFSRALVFEYHEADRVSIALGTPVSGPSQTWLWDGVSWTQDTRSPQPPWGTMYSCYDRARGKMIVLCTTNLDMWEYDRATGWTQRQVTTRPTPRDGFALCWSPVNNHLVLYGGWGLQSPSLLTDTWEFDGTGWSLMNVPGGYAGQFVDARLTYSETLQACVMAGYQSNAAHNLIRPILWCYDHRSWYPVTAQNDYWISSQYRRPFAILAYDRQSEIDIYWNWGYATFQSRLRFPTVVPAQPRYHPGDTMMFAVNTPPPYSGVFVPMYSFGVDRGVSTAQLGIAAERGASYGILPVNPDALFLATLGHSLLQLDSIGQASFSWRVPSLPSLIGLKLYVSGARLTPRMTVDWIAAPRSVEIF